MSRCDPSTGIWGECECAGTQGSAGAALASGGAGATPASGASTGGAVAACDGYTGIDASCAAHPLERILRNRVLLVLDRSASMAEQPAGYGTSKWDALRAALSQVLPEVQHAIDVGLEVFPTTATRGDPIPSSCAPVDRCCEMPADTEMNVPVGDGPTTIPTILEALEATRPVGGAPTSAALARALEYFRPELDGRPLVDHYVVLVTDGAPMCNQALICDASSCVLNLEGLDGCTVDGRNCCEITRIACLDDAATFEQILESRSTGVSTIVVGLPGTELYSSTLTDFALAGGVERPDGSVNHYAPATEHELTDTLRTILDELFGTCTAVLREWVYDVNAVELAVDCEVIPHTGGVTDAAQNGWWFSGEHSGAPHTVNIAGPVCDRILTEGVERIDALMNCVSDEPE